MHVFMRSGGAWTEQARLQSSNAERADSFGAWVAISDDGNTVAAGALDEDSFLTNVNRGDQGADDQATDTSAGAAYVFTRTGNTWPQQAFIKASNTGKEDWFGVRLALSGDGNTVVVSAPNEDGANDAAQEAGAVYVYTRSAAGAWSHQVDLKGANTEQFDEFGSAVALSSDGRTMAVGARFDEQAGGPVSDSGRRLHFRPVSHEPYSSAARIVSATRLSGMRSAEPRLHASASVRAGPGGANARTRS